MTALAQMNASWSEAGVDVVALGLGILLETLRPGIASASACARPLRRPGIFRQTLTLLRRRGILGAYARG